MRRWKSINASVTSPRGLAPSKVAALMILFLKVRGPSRAGPKTAGAGGSGSAGMRGPLLQPGRRQGGHDGMDQVGMADHEVRQPGVSLGVAQR